VGQGITSLLGPSDIILFLLGKEKTVTILASFFLTLNIVFSFIASKHFGFEGVATTQALTNVFLYLILTVYLKSKYSINSTVFQRH
jgi:O-antigen/teichoic acid export membrane protein